MCKRGCRFLFLSKFLVLTRYLFYGGISFFPFHVSLTISSFKDSPPCFVINIWESISWVPSHTRDGYALPKITNHFHCVLFCLFFYRVSTLQLLLSRATLLWVMLQRLDCPYLTSAWKETRAGSHCQPVRHNQFSSSSVGYGANRLPPQLCAPPLRAFRAHTPFVQVYSDRLLYLLIPLRCYGHVSPHPHYSFWNGSLSATTVLRNYPILSTYAVVLHSHGTWQMYLYVYMHVCV